MVRLSTNGITAEQVAENVIFDLTRVTARELARIHIASGSRLGRVAWLNKLYPMVVTACPPEWGAPEQPETYDLDMFTTGKWLFDAYNKAAAAVKPEIASATFDLTGITLTEFDKLLASATGYGYGTQARFMARFVRTCDAISGDLTKADTYLNLPFFTHFQPLMQRLMNAGNEMLENFLKPSETL